LKKGQKKPVKWSLTTWLTKYYAHQDKIVLVYRPTPESSWANRCMYLDNKYNPLTPYNHRTILHNEVVIEFDNDDPEKNLALSKEVKTRLNKDGILLSHWHSGNKSYHVHCLINTGNCHNVPLLKKCFMEYYSDGLGVPDTRLAVENHLVRAEFGIHEKTGKNKSLLYKDTQYPSVSNVPDGVWQRYYAEQRLVVSRRLSRDVNKLIDHPGMQYILTSHQFREANDGRERALFMLIHVLKPKFLEDKEGLIRYLQDWYKYSGGTQLKDFDIKNKVNYHWSRHYEFGDKYLRELLESIGRGDLMELPNSSKPDA
jgi:hypothetical protein